MEKQWLPDMSVTPVLARGLIEEQFPELLPADVQFMGEGWDNTVFAVNHSLVFRFPRRQMAVACLQAENRVLPWLAPLMPVPTPDPVYVGHPGSRYPYPFSGYRMLPGRTAYTADLSAAERIQSAGSFASFLKALHAIPLQEATRMGAEPDKIGRMDIAKRIEKFEVYAEEAVTRGLVDDIQPYRRVIRALPGREQVPQEQVLVHGDLNFRNFLVDVDGTLSGVIDWGDVHVGHPAVDLSILYSFFPPAGRQVFRHTYGEIPEMTLRLARFRAMYVNLYLLVYAHDIGDLSQFREAGMALRLVFDE